MIHLYEVLEQNSSIDRNQINGCLEQWVEGGIDCQEVYETELPSDENVLSWLWWWWHVNIYWTIHLKCMHLIVWKFSSQSLFLKGWLPNSLNSKAYLHHHSVMGQSAINSIRSSLWITHRQATWTCNHLFVLDLHGWRNRCLLNY